MATLYSDLNDAKAIAQGGNPNLPKARRFIAVTIDRAMRRIVDAEVLASHVLRGKEAEKSAKKILAARWPECSCGFSAALAGMKGSE